MPYSYISKNINNHTVGKDPKNLEQHFKLRNPRFAIRIETTNPKPVVCSTIDGKSVIAIEIIRVRIVRKPYLPLLADGTLFFLRRTEDKSECPMRLNTRKGRRWGKK